MIKKPMQSYSAENKNTSPHYFLIFFIIFFAYYIINFVHPHATDPYIITQYLVSYKFGFISRGLIGSILSCLRMNQSLWHIYIFITIFNLLLISVVSHFMALILKSSNNENRKPLFILLLFYAVSPGSITYLFAQKNFGRLEVFCLIIMFLSLIIILKNSKLIFFLPVFCIVSILIYQTAIFMYLPPVLFLLFFLWSKKRERKYLSVFIIAAALSCIAFIYMQLFGKVQGVLFYDFVKMVSANSDFEVSRQMIEAEYFMPLQGHLELVSGKMRYMIPRFIISVIVFAPAIMFIYYFYLKSVRTSPASKKVLYIIMSLSALTILPMFAFAVDYGRWISAFFITQYSLVFALFAFDSDVFARSLYNIFRKLEQKYYVVFPIIIFYAYIGRCSHFEVLPLSCKIIDIFYVIRSCIAMALN